MMSPLLESYDKTVSSSSFEDLVRTSNSWLDQHASLVQLRPLVIEALKDLSINTDILTEPHRMPQVGNFKYLLSSSIVLFYITLMDEANV